MSELSQRNNGSTAIAEKTEFNLDWSLGNTIHGKTTAPLLPKYILQPFYRKKKVRKIRQQLAEDRYDIDERLNVALDLLLEVLIS